MRPQPRDVLRAILFVALLLVVVALMFLSAQSWPAM